MPAISFQRKFLDALLRGDKQQTTRKQTDRIKVGDVAHIYIEQRRRITEKPMRRATPVGQDMIIRNILNGKYPVIPNRVYINPEYYAHFLGTVEISEVYDIIPNCMDGENSWARDDGFFNVEAANNWFTEQYGTEWRHQTWTVIKWDGWLDRYFGPEP